MANRRLNCTTREAEEDYRRKVFGRLTSSLSLASKKMIKRKEEGHLLGVKIAAADPKRTTDRDPSITVPRPRATELGNTDGTQLTKHVFKITLCLIFEPSSQVN